MSACGSGDIPPEPISDRGSAGALWSGLRVLPFRERLPWIGGDLQTLRNTVLARSITDLPGTGERFCLPLDGGDALSARLDRGDGDPSRPLIVLIHGLTGSETSHCVMLMARTLCDAGYSVLRLNLRGAGPSRATSCGHYHAARTDDLAAALSGVPGDLVRAGIVLVGFSLGANLSIRFMGERGQQTGAVRGAVAISPPLDLAAAAACLLRPRNRIYHRSMLHAMQQEATAPGAVLERGERAAILQARTIVEFDDRFIAPRYGFAGAQDYYAKASCGPVLGGIRVPTLVVHAQNDPWIPFAAYRAIPWDRLSAVHAILPKGGGHVGFHGRGTNVPWTTHIVLSFVGRLA